MKVIPASKPKEAKGANMPTRDNAPKGAPCWTDLWTSDVDGSRKFYSELLGWEALDPNPEFGGYFMFTRDGVPIAGGMGGMPGMPAQNVWKVFLQTDDIDKTLELTTSAGGQVSSPSMPVADLGTQAVIADPTGAGIGVWQPGTFPGFTVLQESGAPSWFELYTRDYAGAIEFYRSVFGWEVDSVGDTDDFRYSTARSPEAAGEIGGIMDASSFLPDGAPAHWTLYFDTTDIDETLEKLEALGGSVIQGADDTPYGRIASVSDPSGAQFRLRTPPT
jgi:uncharacterized protein